MDAWRLFSVLTAVVSLVSCSSTDSDDTERTFPEAFNFEVVTIQQLLNEVQPPDSVNIEVYVVAIHECPKNSACFLPDRIEVSESVPPSDKLTISVKNPSQFKVNTQYKISVQVTNRNADEHKELHILGYTQIE